MAGKFWSLKVIPQSLNEPTLDGLSTVAVIVAVPPAVRVPEAGETWHQVPGLPAVLAVTQFNVAVPGLLSCVVRGPGLEPWEIPEKVNVPGFKLIPGIGWGPTLIVTDLVSVPPGPVQESV